MCCFAEHGSCSPDRRHVCSRLTADGQPPRPGSLNPSVSDFSTEPLQMETRFGHEVKCNADGHLALSDVGEPIIIYSLPTDPVNWALFRRYYLARSAYSSSLSSTSFFVFVDSFLLESMAEH